MNTPETILTVECSLLVVFLLLIFGALVISRWNRIGFRYNNGSNELKRKYIILPQTSPKFVQLERNIKQFTDRNTEDGMADNDCTIIDETLDRAESGRIYFSLKYDTMSHILEIKLIKGENLPIIPADASKPYVNVQLICYNTDSSTPTSAVKKSINNNYKRTYKFRFFPNEFASHMIHFEISRFDRFSRKYNIGYVFISLAELRYREFNFNRETFFTKDVTCTNENKNETRKRRRLSDTDLFDDRQILHRVQKNSKTRQRKPRILWNKLSHAVHAGICEELRRNPHESLQWDPFLVAHRYEYSDSDTTGQHSSIEDNSSPDKSDLSQRADSGHSESIKKVPDWFSNVFYSSGDSSSGSGTHTEESLQLTPQRGRSLNQDFYRLVHSPPLIRRGSSQATEPITSWSIPETFQFSPPPSQIKKRTVVFHNASAETTRHDRLHKLTSLSSSYREKILRKSRKKVSCRTRKLTGKISLHKSLYLGKENRKIISAGDKPLHKRQRKTRFDE